MKCNRSSLAEICLCSCWDTSKWQSSCQVLTSSSPGESWCLRPKVFFPPCLIVWGIVTQKSQMWDTGQSYKGCSFLERSRLTHSTLKNKQAKKLHTYLSGLGSCQSTGIEDVKKSAAGQLGSEQNMLSLKKQYCSLPLMLSPQVQANKSLYWNWTAIHTLWLLLIYSRTQYYTYDPF